MKYLLAIGLIWFSVILIVGLLLSGCASQLINTPQPELHPIEGVSVMFIPEGCKIGDIETTEDGIYIGESQLIEQMIRQREEENKRRRQESRKRTSE